MLVSRSVVSRTVRLLRSNADLSQFHFKQDVPKKVLEALARDSGLGLRDFRYEGDSAHVNSSFAFDL